MSQDDPAEARLKTVQEVALACGLDAASVRLVGVTAVGPSHRRALETAVTGMVGRRCRSTVAEILDLEVRGARLRVGLPGGAGDRAVIEQALRRNAERIVSSGMTRR